MWARYHITEPLSFYDRTNGWAVAQDPGTNVATGTPAQNQTIITTPTGQVARQLAPRIDPYYLLMKLPDEERESFLMLRPFVPYAADDSQRQLTAFMVAKSEPDQYGKLVVYEMPSGQLPDGPAVVNATIQANELVARQISLLNREGSTVSYGDLLLVPIENTILYVRPLYVSSEGSTEVQELKNVIVVFGSEVVMRPTLRQALEVLLGVQADTFERQIGIEVPTDPADDPTEGLDDPSNGSTTTTTPPTGEPSDIDQLLADANRLITEANDALTAGGPTALATYQQKVNEAAEKIAEAERVLSSTTTTSLPETEA
jgi:uncharacterized membrane protein (UPF0182 family)